MLTYVLTLCLEQYASSSAVSACPTTYYVDSDGLDGPHNVERHRATTFQSQGLFCLYSPRIAISVTGA